MGRGWEVILEPEVSTWILGLADDTYDRVEAAIDILAQSGPGLGRPLVDSTTGSRHPNMTELRVGTCRILVAFDPVRNAISLVAGDERGQWRTWFPPAIPAPGSGRGDHFVERRVFAGVLRQTRGVRDRFDVGWCRDVTSQVDSQPGAVRPDRGTGNATYWPTSLG